MSLKQKANLTFLLFGHPIKMNFAPKIQMKKTIAPSIAIFVILALTLTLFGCLLIAGCTNTAPDSTVQLTIAADALAVSEQVLTAADQAHVIPAADRPAVAAAVYVAQRDIAAAQANVGNGAAASAIAQVNADLAALVTLRLKYQNKPATKPS